MSAFAGKKKGSRAPGFLAAVAVILALLGIAFAAYAFIRYRNTGNPHPDASQSRVVISHPVNMAEVPAGKPVQVDVNAVGLLPFTFIELWINGVLEGVQATPPSGLTSLVASFSWIPPQAVTSPSWRVPSIQSRVPLSPRLLWCS